MKEFTGYMHGVNLGGWFSQCDYTKERYETFINEEDIKTISSWGLDHVRIPVDYDLVEEKDGTRREEGFAYLQRAIDWCGKYGLNMVLDLHKTVGYSFDPEEKESGFFSSPAAQERFYRLWEEFAHRYGKYEDRLCFELLNEVTDKSYSEIWNGIAAECIRRIRVIAPTIRILVGGYHHNSFHALKDLRMPADENIVYNFHFYEPILFTHQGAYWVAGMDRSFRLPLHSPYRIYAENTQEMIKRPTDDLVKHDPEKALGMEFFDDCIAEAAAVARERDVPLYCGEFGVIDLASAEDTLEWYRMICSCLDRYGIGRAAWSYKEMDFGLTDSRLDGIRPDLLRLL